MIVRNRENNYMSNYMVIICFFLFRCTHSLPMEGLGEVCILNKPFVNREPYLVFSGRYCVIQKKSVPLRAVLYRQSMLAV